MALYPIDPLSPPQSEGSKRLRDPLDAVGPVVGFGIVFPGEPEKRKQLRAERVAVDLTDVIDEDARAYEDDLEGTEGDGAS